MKKAKLIAVAALALSFGVPSTLASCNNAEPSPSVTPVSRIKVTPPAHIVVGVEVNLDDYVEVEGGEGPKVYDIEVPAAQASKVQVSGHKLTALVEATEIAVTIKAGGQTARFGCPAYSQLKANYAEFTKNLQCEWAAWEIVFDENTGAPIGVIPQSVHRNDYSWFNGWTEEGLPGGLLKAKNGNTYEYEFTSAGELQVNPSIYSDFSLYFMNMPWCITADDLEYVETTNADTGEVYKNLVSSKDTPVPAGYESYFPSYNAYAMSRFGIGVATGYEYGDIIISEIDLNGENETYHTFLINAQVLNSSTGQYAGSFPYILDLRKDSTEILDVREYIDAGNHPDPIDDVALKQNIAAMAESTSYHLDVEFGWFDDTSVEANPVDNPFIAMGAEYALYAMCLGTGYETVDYNSTNGITYKAYGENYIGDAIAETTKLGAGYDIQDSEVNYYDNGVEQPDGSVVYGDVYNGIPSEFTAAEVKSSMTLNAFANVPATSIEVLAKDETNPEQPVWKVNSNELVTAILCATNAGYYADLILQGGWETDMRGYVDIYMSISETLVNYSLVLTWDTGVYWVLDMVVSGVNGTTVTHPEYVMSDSTNVI